MQLVFAEDDDAAGGLVGGFEGFLEAEAAVAKLDGEAGAMVSLQMVDGQYLRGPVVRTLLGEKTKVSLRKYGVMRGPMTVKVTGG